MRFVLMSFIVVLCSTHTVIAEGPIEKLERAKSKHDQLVEAISKDFVSWVDGQEKTARKNGDVEKLRSMAKVREQFSSDARFTKDAPAKLAGRLKSARLQLDEAYATAIRDLTKQNKDDDVKLIEIERESFFESTTESAYLQDLSFKRKRHAGDLFSVDGTILSRDVVVDGKKFPKTLFVHPGDNDNSEIVYLIDKQWETLKGTCGVPRLGDAPEAAGIGTALTFEITGDQKLLWSSQPTKEFEKTQQFSIDVTGVTELTLRVRCPGSSWCARSCWLDPFLIVRR